MYIVSPHAGAVPPQVELFSQFPDTIALMVRAMPVDARQKSITSVRMILLTCIIVLEIFGIIRVRNILQKVLRTIISTQSPVNQAESLDTLSDSMLMAVSQSTI